MPRKLVMLLAIAPPLALLDQLAKFLVELELPVGARYPLPFGILHITHARNPGAAFGLLANAPGPWLFAVVSLVAIAVVLSYFARLAPRDGRSAVALSLVLAGTVSNLWDRIRRGEVVDYLHVRMWDGFIWPDFNLADVAIVVGVLALILELLAQEAAGRAGPAG